MEIYCVDRNGIHPMYGKHPKDFHQFVFKVGDPLTKRIIYFGRDVGGAGWGEGNPLRVYNADDEEIQKEFLDNEKSIKLTIDDIVFNTLYSIIEQRSKLKDIRRTIESELNSMPTSYALACDLIENIKKGMKKIKLSSPTQ